MFCNACGTEISENAVACPSCGEPTAKAKKPISKGALVASYVLAAGLPIIGWIMGVYLLIKGRIGHALAVIVIGITFFFVWAGALYANPEFEWECAATGASSLQCEVKNSGSATGSLSFDVVAYCDGNTHRGAVTVENVQQGEILQRVVQLEPEVSSYAVCTGFEYQNQFVD